MKQLSLADMQDLLLGCTILGTGGGGEMSEGLALLEDVYHKGLYLIRVYWGSEIKATLV